MDAIREYYAKRAAEYERIYSKPERQTDLKRLESLVIDALRGRTVLEVACGTGFWTQKIASTCGNITAVDLSAETLQIARGKYYARDNVHFEVSDCFDLGNIKGSFEAGLAMFWWSHVPRPKLNSFFKQLHSRLTSPARVVLADNHFVPGSNTPISRVDADGNTYQRRTLENGEEFEILKNFPRPGELSRVLGACSSQVAIHDLDYYWCAVYDL